MMDYLPSDFIKSIFGHSNQPVDGYLVPICFNNFIWRLMRVQMAERWFLVPDVIACRSCFYFVFPQPLADCTYRRVEFLCHLLYCQSVANIQLLHQFFIVPRGWPVTAHTIFYVLFPYLISPSVVKVESV